jgi:Fe(3+) dicitrate transport protein
MPFNKCRAFIIILILALPVYMYAQSGILSGTITAKDGSRADEALLYIRNLQITIKPAEDGSFKTQALPYGHYECVVTAAGMVRKVQKVHLNFPQQEVNFQLDNLESEIDPITITSDKLKGLGSRSLSEVDGAGIYAGRKSEVIELKEIVANTANNNPRQIYGRITGLNIWESDGTGMQLGIGGRGLSPNRTSNFNTRQNGYDISADALGYPESYYTPPAEALDRIEIVRGAASLQYGTQFGGLLNFKMKQGPEDKAIEVHARISGGSFGFLNSFNSIGGTILKGKINYYSFYQRKQGNGWRPNSKFEVNTAYAAISYRPGVRCTLTAEYTHMNYWAQQPGGLTDTYFMDDPRQSVRSRNWFQVNWDLLALVFDYRISEQTTLNMRTYTLQASRLSLGNLERINVADFGRNRTLIQGEFNNIGHESRLLNTVKIGKQKHTGILGFRAYKGITYARQGDADNGEGPNFRYLNPGNLENSDYRFPNFNYAIFAEHIFNISDEWSLTPGVRWEFIETQAEGYYKQRVFDAAGNIVADTRLEDSNSRYRDFVLAGLGLSWKPNKRIEWYGNISQNYRAINFTDLRINNPNLVVDPELKDERGFTADLGIKGNRIHRFQYEITAFHIAYQDRIGQVLRADRAPLYLDYRYRTNIADARNMGIEAFGELNILPIFKPETSNQLNIFINAAWIHARYLRSEQPGINGNQVEMVPPWVIRTGLTWKHKNFRTSLQYSFTETHFSDASNATRTSTAVEGIIPAYQVVDFSLSYSFKSFTFEGSLNNVLNEMYFTRRAESYPGPGLIPADGRNFTITLQYRFVRPRK